MTAAGREREIGTTKIQRHEITRLGGATYRPIQRVQPRFIHKEFKTNLPDPGSAGSNESFLISVDVQSVQSVQFLSLFGDLEVCCVVR